MYHLSLIQRRAQRADRNSASDLLDDFQSASAEVDALYESKHLSKDTVWSTHTPPQQRTVIYTQPDLDPTSGTDKMCRFITISTKYDQCTADPRHVNTTRTTDTDGFDEFKKTAFKCGDEAFPAKGKSEELIQLGSTTRPGACPKCLP